MTPPRIYRRDRPADKLDCDRCSRDAPLVPVEFECDSGKTFVCKVCQPCAATLRRLIDAGLMDGVPVEAKRD